MSDQQSTASPRASSSWIWSPALDLSVFGLSSVVALVLGLWLRAGEHARMSDASWLVVVLGIDVAHVWSTLFRTYLDRAELARRPRLYVSLPVICYLGGVLLHLQSRGAFWRVLAYAAVFHFIRQQVGWVAIARARAGVTGRLDRALDEAVVYLATGVPLLFWHARQPRAFWWFVEGDFFGGAVVERWAALGYRVGVVAYAAVGTLYVVRACFHASVGKPMWGKHLVVLSTAALWWTGIVGTNADTTFTITNVVPHGVPYFVLLWRYARERATERPRSLIAVVVRGGIIAFFATTLAFAFAEEAIWDRYVWHDREAWFGVGESLSATLLAFLVPLLALPQAVHYALDGLLWRRKDGGAAQARAMGFG